MNQDARQFQAMEDDSLGRAAGMASAARRQGLAVAGGMAGALAASSCCILPLVLFSSLARVPGITHAAVSYETKTAVVTFHDEQADAAMLTAATAAIGYPSHPVEDTGGG